MRLNSIELQNFGSYQGTVAFDTRIQDASKNIILIGGKNGAGKTTLFTGLKICIYGCRAYGYQSTNTFYIRSISKLINNSAKQHLPATTSVSVDMTITNGVEQDHYVISRGWTYRKNTSIVEKLTVSKNGLVLSSSALVDFEKYITQLIPPELFNLYFFDGERIAEFFLDEGGNARLKNAFLTLCGYDTFSIMSKNFRRIHDAKGEDNALVEEYFKAKSETEKTEGRVSELSLNSREISRLIDTTTANIEALDSNYKKIGGLTKAEIEAQEKALKDEDRFREEANAWIKKIANDTLPFLILSKELRSLSKQIQLEEEAERRSYFVQQLKASSTQEIINSVLDGKVDKDTIQEVIEQLIAKQGNENNQKAILALSPDEKVFVLHTIAQLSTFPVESIQEKNRAIKESIQRSQEIRDKLVGSDLTAAHKYMEQRAALVSEQASLLQEKVNIGDELHEAETALMLAEETFKRVKVKYEEALKKTSINDIAVKAIMMLDKLQDQLYKSQIKKMESAFHTEINRLMRKSHFIDEIIIDSHFNIRIYRNDLFSGKQLSTMYNDYGTDRFGAALGQRAMATLRECMGADVKRINADSLDSLEKVELPIEIDQSSLSNGEKQIFIMALYKALMSLCSREVPFVIDTPFARIDTEHRHNIVQFFFRELHGQIFILSTNEEISGAHFSMISDKLAATYTLENNDNKFTHIVKDHYFEEES